MKKIILLSMVMALAISSFSQKPVLTKEEYLKKSKNQKVTARIMLGGGASLILLGNLIGNREESSFDEAGSGFIIAAIGGASMLGSIPLFIAAGKNKRKAMELAFINEKVPIPRNGSFTKLSCPSVGIRVRL